MSLPCCRASARIVPEENICRPRQVKVRTVPYDTVVSAVAGLVMKTNYVIPGDILDALKRIRGTETSELAQFILDQIIENDEIASAEKLPICQDTGVAVFFADVGGDARVGGDGLDAAINEGTRIGYRDGGLRMSIVRDPLRRVNTGDNTPAVIHYTCVSGDSIHLSFCPKGAGCENMSRTAMLNPGSGSEGIVDFVLETVRDGGGRPCPPGIVGIGLGGDFEYSAILSKRALLRTIGTRHPDPFYSALETGLLDALNSLGTGPMGLGGRSTALDVFIEAAPCHIASLPVAVNIQCHAARHGSLVI